jgi:hypothetical protein
MNLVDELYAIAAALQASNIRYAVCGGIAVTAHGAPRSTKDIDIIVERSQLTAVLQAVAPLGFNIPAGPMVFGAGTPNERHVQRVSKVVGSSHLILDLLLAEAAYAGVLDDRVEISMASGPMAFVSFETLLRMKRLADRPIDRADVQKLMGDDE